MFNRFIFLILTTTLLVGCKTIHATDSYESEIYGYSRPVDIEKPNGQQFEYKYRFVNNGMPKTIIFIPGGPGDTSIQYGTEQSRPMIDYLFPNGKQNLVFTDPRGFGRNSIANKKIPNSFYSSESIAEDIVSIIHHLNLKDYVIFGHSHGTMIATIVSNKLESNRADINAPAAIVLMGAFGKYLNEPYSGFQEQWDRVRKAIDPLSLELLSREQLPFGLSNEQWGQFIVKNLFQEVISWFPGKDKGIIEKLNYLATQDSEALDKLKQEVIKSWPQPEPTIGYKKILCEEILPHDNTDLSLVRGELVGPLSPNFCDGYSPIRPFDSAKYPMKTKIYYIQGENDPATDFKTSYYHFTHQEQTTLKNFVIIRGGSHSLPIGRIEKCLGQVWDAVFNGESLEDSTRACHENILNIIH